MNIADPGWVGAMLAMCAMHEGDAPDALVKPQGWPVGTLVHNVTNGRRGRIWSVCGDSCAIEFSDRGNVWLTTWDVVRRNYRKV